MKLGGIAIEKALQDGTWKAYRGETRIPWGPELSGLIGPNSIDVTLSRHIIEFKGDVPINLRDPASLLTRNEIITEEDGGYTLEPGTMILGCTNERFDCSAPLDGCYYAPMYEGRSTIARCGVGSHVTAGFGDYGFQGAFTLEIFNVGRLSVILYPNIRIGQIFFDEVKQPKLYEGAYAGTNHYNGPQLPVLGLDRFPIQEV